LRAFGVRAIVLSIVSACTVANVKTPDPAAFLSGEPIAIGGEPTGPITELGSGVAFDQGWRYVIYESDEGWCTELQMVEVTATGCGPDPELAEGEHLGGVGALEPLENGATPVEGVVSDEIVTVFIIDERVGRLPAELMPREAAGLGGQAFVGFMPADGTPTHVQAVALSGEILATYELP
jgi:hypothetical protein